MSQKDFDRINEILIIITKENYDVLQPEYKILINKVNKSLQSKNERCKHCNEYCYSRPENCSLIQ